MPFPTAKNYLYDLHKDVLVLIYKGTFKATLKNIDNIRETNDDFNKLMLRRAMTTKNKVFWNIIAKRDIGDPSYKYQYYDSLILNKSTANAYAFTL
jgi:hypothetical protein